MESPPFSVGYTVGSSRRLFRTAWFLRSPAVACVPVPVPQSRTHIVQLHETFHRAAFQEHSSSPPSWTPALRGCVLVKERDAALGVPQFLSLSPTNYCWLITSIILLFASVFISRSGQNFLICPSFSPPTIKRFRSNAQFF